MDVDGLLTRAPPGWTLKDGEAAVYSHRDGGHGLYILLLLLCFREW